MKVLRILVDQSRTILLKLIDSDGQEGDFSPSEGDFSENLDDFERRKQAFFMKMQMKQSKPKESEKPQYDPWKILNQVRSEKARNKSSPMRGFVNNARMSYKSITGLDTTQKIS